MEIPKPTAEHEWLKQLIGEWTCEGECPTGPDQPTEKFQGVESVRSLGDLWVLCEGRSEMPGGGGESRAIFTFGFDPKKQKFVGTFVASVMMQLWTYEGRLDAARKVLTLDTVGPCWTDENKMANYHDIIEIVDADHRMLSSELQADDGTWQKFMTMRYTRKK